MTSLQDLSSQFSHLAPSGFYVALRVGFSFPSEELNRLPEEWVKHYTRYGLVIHDPMMKWVYANSGSILAEDIPLPDTAGVMPTAAIFGLRHGVVISITRSSDHGRRSYGFFFRADRAFDEGERERLTSMMTDLHDGLQGNQTLTGAEIEALKMQAQGLRLKQIGGALGISESAVKARLNNAKRKLGAKTPSQAASIAAQRRLF